MEADAVTDVAAQPKAASKHLFNVVAPYYDAGPGVFAHFGRRLAAFAGIEASHRVLDAATGRGAVLFPAAEQVGAAGYLVGIDFAGEMVRATAEEAARQNLRVQVRVMDVEHIEFPDAAFDRVLCGAAVMFFQNQGRALAEFRRVLAPGGRVAVSTFHTSQITELEPAILSALGVIWPRPPGWITEPDHLAKLLTAAGFGNARVRMDTHSFHYATPDEYWEQARGTGMRAILDSLDPAPRDRVRAALADRMQPYRRPEGFYQVPITYLLGLADR